MQTQIACKAYSNLYCGISFFIKLGEKWQEQRLGIHHYQKGALDKRELPIVQKIPFCNNLQIREFFCPNIGNMPWQKKSLSLYSMKSFQLLPTWMRAIRTFDLPSNCLVQKLLYLEGAFLKFQILERYDHFGKIERFRTLWITWVILNGSWHFWTKMVRRDDPKPEISEGYFYLGYSIITSKVWPLKNSHGWPGCNWRPDGHIPNQKGLELTVTSDSNQKSCS